MVSSQKVVNTKNNFHVLIVRLSSMGDVLLASSAVKFLRLIYGENIIISFLTWDSFSPILKNASGIDHLLTFSKTEAKLNKKNFYSSVKRHHQTHSISLIWDLQGNWWSFGLRLRFPTIVSMTIDKRKWERLILLFSRINLYKSNTLTSNEWHQVTRLWKDFAPIFTGKPLTFSLSRADLFPYRTVKEKIDRVVFLPSAAHPLKKWPLQNFEKLLKILDQQLPATTDFFCLSGPGEVDALDLGKIILRRKIKVSNSLSLPESLALVAESKFVVSNDTGLMHQAWIHQSGIVSIFGPTVEQYGFSPYGRGVGVLSSPLICRPCSVTGSGLCWRFGTHQCMKDITPEMVAAVVMQKWNEV